MSKTPMRTPSLRRCTLAGAAPLLVLTTVGACFGDLPAPVTTSDAGDAANAPADATNTCVATYPVACQASVTTLACGPPLAKCLRPSSGSCTCNEATECPAANGGDCYMRGSSCPDGLLATHPTAICLSFDDAAVPAGAGTCQCACTACMRRCDGEGPLLFYPGTDGAIAPMLYVGVSLAAGKRIGVYVRARGVTASAGVVQALGFAPLAGASPQPLAANGPQVYEETVIAPDLSKPAPDGIVLLGTSASALMVDCIVPFYEP